MTSIVTNQRSLISFLKFILTSHVIIPGEKEKKNREMINLWNLNLVNLKLI